MNPQTIKGYVIQIERGRTGEEWRVTAQTDPYGGTVEWHTKTPPKAGANVQVIIMEETE